MGLKRCNQGHVIHDQWQTCPFCSQGESSGSTELIDVNDREGKPSASVERTREQTGPPLNERTRMESFTGERTVLERDGDETMMDEDILVADHGFVAWVVFVDEEGKPLHDVRLVKEKTIMGKGMEADIRINDNFASKLHALIHFEGGLFHISDLGSTNHTWVNEQRAMLEPLNDGDRIRIGHKTMIFKRVRREW